MVGYQLGLALEYFYLRNKFSRTFNRPATCKMKIQFQKFKISLVKFQRGFSLFLVDFFFWGFKKPLMDLKASLS